MATHTLSEADSRAIVAAAGVAVAPCTTVTSPRELDGVDIAYPAVAKLCGDAIAHKTERGLVRLGLTDRAALDTAVTELLAATTADDGDVTVLVSPMVTGNRELIAGLTHDDQFGAVVMVGLGGILAEALADVTFRLAPVSESEAHSMIDDLGAQAILGEFRGEPAIDRSALAATLVALGALPGSDPSVVSVDLNPLIISNGSPIAVDALVERAL